MHNKKHKHTYTRIQIFIKKNLCNTKLYRKRKKVISEIFVAGVDVLGRTPRTEMECQHEGGTCEFFVLCWMTGGLLQGTCDSLLHGCCHRTAKSSNLGPEAGKTFDLTDLPNTEYGPVQNDPSECT